MGGGRRPGGVPHPQPVSPTPVWAARNSHSSDVPDIQTSRGRNASRNCRTPRIPATATTSHPTKPDHLAQHNSHPSIIHGPSNAPPRLRPRRLIKHGAVSIPSPSSSRAAPPTCPVRTSFMPMYYTRLRAPVPKHDSHLPSFLRPCSRLVPCSRGVLPPPGTPSLKFCTLSSYIHNVLPADVRSESDPRPGHVQTTRARAPRSSKRRVPTGMDVAESD